MSQWDYKIDQPMPGPFPSPIQEKALGSRLAFCPTKLFILIYFWGRGEPPPPPYPPGFTPLIVIHVKFSRICYYIYALKLLGERLVCLNLYEALFSTRTIVSEILENVITLRAEALGERLICLNLCETFL